MISKLRTRVVVDVWHDCTTTQTLWRRATRWTFFVAFREYTLRASIFFKSAGCWWNKTHSGMQIRAVYPIYHWYFMIFLYKPNMSAIEAGALWLADYMMTSKCALDSSLQDSHSALIIQSEVVPQYSLDTPKTRWRSCVQIP